MSDPPAWRSLYPFESHYAEIAGRRYHYLDEGRGAPLVMVHGNPTWSFYWREMVQAWRDRYRVIVPDHIGCGLSDKPGPGEYSFRLAERISDLGHLIRELDLHQVTLVAHDWGGAVGMGAAVAWPERFARFVLMNTAAFRSKRCPLRIRVCRSPLGQLAVQGLNLFGKAALRMASWHPERMTPAVRAGLLAPYDSWHNRTAVYRFVRDIPLSPKHPTYQTLCDMEAGLAQFAKQPVCLIWGMHDWCFPAEFLERFEAVFPQAEVHRLEDAGHYVVEDAPDQVAALVGDFLQRHPLK